MKIFTLIVCFGFFVQGCSHSPKTSRPRHDDNFATLAQLRADPSLEIQAEWSVRSPRLEVTEYSVVHALKKSESIVFLIHQGRVVDDREFGVLNAGASLLSHDCVQVEGEPKEAIALALHDASNTGIVAPSQAWTIDELKNQFREILPARIRCTVDVSDD